LDGAPEEEEDDEDDDAPLVPPSHPPTLEKPKLEPFDSDPGGLGGSGYDSWGPKIDLSAELPAEPATLDAESIKAALAAPGTPEPPKTERASESSADSGKKSDSEAASRAKSAAKARSDRASDADADGDEEPSDQRPADSEVPDTKPSARARKASRRKAKKKRSAARATSSTPSPAESKGVFTPLRTVLVVLGLLAFIWLIRSSPSPRTPSGSTPPPAPTSEAPGANALAPPAPGPVTPRPEMAPEPPADDSAAEPAPSAPSAWAPSAAHPSSLAGDGPLPFDRVSVLSALGPFAIEASRCRRKPDPSGRVMVNLVIAPDGGIKAITTGSMHSGTKTEECILEKLRRAKLDPHAGGDETIALPVQLK
jgi:hypothetical protein